MTLPDDFSQSKRIPLSVLVRALERNKYLIEKALRILSVEDPESTHTEATAVSELLNHWLVNRELAYFINGRRGDGVTALTVIPVNGDHGRGLTALETWITIDKDELVGLLRSRNINVPDNLANAKTDRTPNWDKWRLIPDPLLWECVLLSLNVDPDNVREKRPLISSTRPSDPIFQDKEYKDRIDIAKAHLRQTLRPKWGARDGPQVSLREFAAWVERIRWRAPPELLAIGQRPHNINWDYWLALDLWPLDTACKLMSGYDPSEPTRSEDIENPDINNRPTWVPRRPPKIPHLWPPQNPPP